MKFNMVPVAIQQMIEDLADPSTPKHVKFNKAQVLEAVKSACTTALNAYNKKS